MQGKKRYLALVLFLLLGLITFSFANPDEQLEPVEGNVKKVSEQKDEKKIQTKFEKAEELVEQAEQNPTEEIIAEAEEAIEEAQQEEPELVLEEDLVNRLNNTEPAIDAAALISAVEKMINEATAKEDVTAAKTYFDNNGVATVTNTLEEGTVKENLDERVAYLVKVFADETAPVITGIENNQTTNIDVTLTIEDDTKVETTVTLDGEPIELDTFDKEGTYIVTVTDDAQNKTSITFTIDKTKPKFEGLSSREAHVESYTVDVTDATETTITVQKDHGDFAPITEGTAITEEGTYQLVAVDAAGNKYTTWVIVDRTEPKISGVTNGSYVNKCDRIYISDRYLNKVTINDETYTRSDFTHNTKNEDFKFEKRVCAEGTYTITATDKKGLTRTETFTIDKTAPVVTLKGKNKVLEPGHYTYTLQAEIEEEYAYTALLNGKEYVSGTDITSRENYTLAVTDVAGNVTTIEFAIDKDKPKIEGVKDGGLYNYDIVPTITDKNLDKVTLNDEEYVVGTPITKDGEYTIVAKDKAGNKRTVTFTIDQTPNRVTQTFYRGDNSVGKTYYVTATDKVQFNIGFTELLSEDAVITIGGKQIALTYDKYYKATNSHMYYGYLAADENETILPAGELEISISNITDPAGNNGFYYQTNGKKVIESYKNVVTTNGKKAVYDVIAPIANYVAILQKGDNYQYATNGDTIRFLVQFNEEIVIPENKEDRTFILTINGKEVKFQRSQGAGYEYIAEYKIPKDEANLAEGELTFSISGYKDAAGNTGEPITTAKHQKYYKVTYDKTPIWYNLYQPGVRPVKVVDTVELDGKLYIGEPAEIQFHDNYRIDSIQVNDGKPYVTPQGVHGQIKNITEPGEYTYTLIDGAGLITKVTFVYVTNEEVEPNGIIELTEDIITVNGPFYNVKENTEPVTINGNGHSITQYVTNVDEFQWSENGTRPAMAQIFSSSNNSKVTLNDVNFKGTVQSIMLGHYQSGNKAQQSAFTTELNNVNVIGLEVVSFSQGISPGVVVYGKADLNKVNIYNTKLSALDTDPMWPVYDLAVVNYTTTNIKDSKIGSIYTWTHSYLEITNSEIDRIDTRAFHSAQKGETVIGEGTTVGRINVIPESNYDTKYGYSLTIKKGSTVKVLDISKITNMTYIVIEEGAVVEKVITASGEMTYDEYLESKSPVGQLKQAFKNGGEITISEDIALEDSVELASDKTLTIDLNGKTLEVKDDAIIKSNGNLTVKNGTLENNDIEKNIIVDKEDGVLTLEGVTVKDKASYSGTTIFNRKGLMTINNSNITIDSENTGCMAGAVEACGNTAIENYGDLVITNSTITSDASKRYGITTHGGNVTIDNATLKVHRRGGIAIQGGNVTVNNTNISTYWYAFYVANYEGDTNVTINSGTFIASGYSIIYNGNAVKTNKGLVTINGGTFQTQSNKRNLLTLDGTAAEEQEFGITIKGGTWKATKNNAANFVADGYVYDKGTVKPE